MARPTSAPPVRAARFGVRGALAIATTAGIAVSIQTYLNGALGVSLKSVPLAVFTSTGTAFVLLTVLAVATGAIRRAWVKVRSGDEVIRPWWFFGGILGTAAVWANITVAPVVGVALLTVAVVCGKMTGGLIVDALGLAPKGKRPVTAWRVAGIAAAAAAVVIGAIGVRGELHIGLLLIALLGGAGVAVQQAGNGHVAKVTGELLAMGFVNFLSGAFIMLILIAVFFGFTLPAGGEFPPWGFIGGLMGAGIASAGAFAVAEIGVLRLMLAQVAGQSMGALGVDLIAPRLGHEVTAATIAGVVLALVGTGLAGRVRKGSALAPTPVVNPEN
jgi:transporter family-2 protein